MGVAPSLRKTVIVGAGYIALELAGILGQLGSEVHLLIRRDAVLRSFDHTISQGITDHISNGPIILHKRTDVGDGRLALLLL